MTASLNNPSNSQTRNLAERRDNGISVSLNFEPDTREVWAFVVDSNRGTEFSLREIPHPLALDVYWHPFAYASRLLSAGTYAEITA